MPRGFSQRESSHGQQSEIRDDGRLYCLISKRGSGHSFSYQIPTFKLNGSNLVHFAAWKDHIGFYATPSGNAAFK